VDEQRDDCLEAASSLPQDDDTLLKIFSKCSFTSVNSAFSAIFASSDRHAKVMK